MPVLALVAVLGAARARLGARGREGHPLRRLLLGVRSAPGQLDAVRASRVGFLQGEEVVEVELDAKVLSRTQFVAEATSSRRSMDGLSEQEKVRLNSAR